MGMMLRGARGRFDRGTGKSGGAALGNDDAVGARAIGGANQRAQVMRIFDAVEHNDEAVFAAMLFEQGVDIGVLLARGDRNYALMGVGVGQAIKLLARQEAHLDAAGAAIIDQALHPFVVPLARDANVLEAAGARFQRFANRMNPVENDHVQSSVRQRRRHDGAAALRESQKISHRFSRMHRSDKGPEDFRSVFIGVTRGSSLPTAGWASCHPDQQQLRPASACGSNRRRCRRSEA